LAPSYFQILFYIKAPKPYTIKHWRQRQAWAARLADGPFTRVTRLGEFSPVGRLFAPGRFLKITKVAQIIVQFFHKLRVNFLQGNGLGYILGDFFPSSSGHPALFKQTRFAGWRLTGLLSRAKQRDQKFSKNSPLRKYVPKEPWVLDKDFRLKKLQIKI
jgi:hypothetical protein